MTEKEFMDYIYKIAEIVNDRELGVFDAADISKYIDLNEDLINKLLYEVYKLGLITKRKVIKADSLSTKAILLGRFY